MKNLGKIISSTFFAFAILFVGTLQAQEVNWGVSVEGNMPMFASDPMSINILPNLDIPIPAIDPGNADQLAMGVSAHIDYKINPKTSIMAKAGRTSYDLTSGRFIKGSVTNTPIMLGAKFYPVEGLYVGGEAGANIIKTKIQTAILVDITVASEKETLLSVGPTVGYELDLGKMKLDLGAHYQFVSNQFNYGGVRAGITLPYGG